MVTAVVVVLVGVMVVIVVFFVIIIVIIMMVVPFTFFDNVFTDTTYQKLPSRSPVNGRSSATDSTAEDNRPRDLRKQIFELTESAFRGEGAETE